jgi:hypothetical protein
MTATVVKPKPRPTVKHTTAAEFARADRTANDDLKKEVAEIRVEISRLSGDNIKMRHRIGARINTIVTDATGRYGTDPRREVEALMPLSRDGIRPMMRLAELYDDAEVDTLLGYRHPVTAEGITWSHVVAITRVRDKSKALEYAERAVTKGWSSKELVSEIVRDAGGPRSMGGRKAKRSTSVTACCGAITAAAVQWNNAVHQTWTGTGGIGDLVESADPSTEIMEALEGARAAVDNMVRAAMALNAELHTNIIRVRAALAPKAPVI